MGEGGGNGGLAKTWEYLHSSENDVGQKCNECLLAASSGDSCPAYAGRQEKPISLEIFIS